MQMEAATTIAISVFSAGVVWGTLNNRIKQLEAKTSDLKDIGSKVTKMEVQIDFIFQKLKET